MGKSIRNTALCYVRQSWTKSPDDISSPQRQQDIIRAYCEKFGWDMEWFIDADGHKSGRGEENRAEWMRLKGRLKDADVIALVVYDQSRVMRNVWRAGRLFEELPQYGVQLHIASNGRVVDITTADGRMSAFMQAFMDDWYAHDVSVRVKRMIEHRKSKNKTWAIPPFGTVRNKEGYLQLTTAGVWILPDGTIAPADDNQTIPAEGAVWRGYADCAQRILEKYAENMHGYNRTAEILASEQWYFKDRDGKPRLLSSDDIRRVTHNYPAYAGLVVEGKAKRRNSSKIDNPEAILYDTGRAVFPLDLLRRVAEVQKKRSVTTRPTGAVKKAHNFILHRLVYCAHCEEQAIAHQNPKAQTRLMGWNQNGKLRYRHAEGIQCGCRKRSILASIIEEQFIALMESLSFATDVNQLMEQYALLLSHPQDDKSAVEVEEKRRIGIATAKRKLDNNLFLFKEGTIAREEYLLTKNLVERDLSHYEIMTSDTEKQAIALTRTMQAFQQLRQVLQESDATEVQRYVHELFDKIIFDLDKQRIVGFRLQAWADSYLVCNTALLAKKWGVDAEIIISSNVPINDPNGTRTRVLTLKG